MELEEIFMKKWLKWHGRTKVVDTDQWYLYFANRLLPLISESDFYEENVLQNQQDIAIRFALYLEDCVADSGNWRQFVRWHKAKYGKYLPFYSLSEEYYLDEINLEDVAFLLWASNMPDGENTKSQGDPFDEKMLNLTRLIYKKLDAVFEEAPMSNALAGDWLIKTEVMQKQRTQIPAAVSGEKLPVNVKRFLKANNRASLMYVESYEKLRDFFVSSLGWEDKEEATLPELKAFSNFVLYANSKGMLIAPNVAHYFSDPRNPLYNKELAETQACKLFSEKGLCPFDLLKYAMEHRLLPDAQFSYPRGKEMLHNNWDFIARWFLDEYYEGD